MRTRSFGSVKITYLDRKAAVRAVERAARRLATKHPEIRRILLFGSLGRGDAVPGSDADLLLVLERCDLPFRDRLASYRLGRCPVPVEVFPYLESEISEMLHEGNQFLKQALTEGITVFERP